MNKTLTSLVFAGSTILSSCIGPNLKNQNMVYGNEVNSIESSDGRYRLPIITLAGRDFTTERSPRRIGEELDLLLKEYGVKNSLLLKDRNKERFELETPTVFVVAPYLVPSSSNPSQKVLGKEFVFNTEGQYSLKANLRSEKDKDLAVRTSTHRSIVYEIPTIKVDADTRRQGLEEFYVGVTRDDAGNVKDIVLIDTDRTQELIDTSNGKIILRSPLGMYALEEMPTATYNSRLLHDSPPNKPESKKSEIPTGTVTPKN